MSHRIHDRVRIVYEFLILRERWGAVHLWSLFYIHTVWDCLNVSFLFLITDKWSNGGQSSLEIRLKLPSSMKGWLHGWFMNEIILSWMKSPFHGWFMSADQFGIIHERVTHSWIIHEIILSWMKTTFGLSETLLMIWVRRRFLDPQKI